MIKSSSQLKKAQERLIEIQKLLAENSQRYSGLELEIYNAALVIEEKQLLDQIIEYEKLKDLPLNDAIDYLSNKPVLLDNVGELLAKLRIAAKLSQSEMAKRLDWEQSNLSRFESENYNAQTINKIVEYASVLGIWLHISPSLTEELGVKERVKAEIKTRQLDSIDVVSTSTSYSEEYTSDRLRKEKFFVGAEQRDVISI